MSDIRINDNLTQEQRVRLESAHGVKGFVPLTDEDKLLLQEIVGEVLSRESEYLVNGLYNGLKGETNDARLYVRRREERLQKLERLHELFEVEIKR